MYEINNIIIIIIMYFLLLFLHHDVRMYDFLWAYSAWNKLFYYIL